MPRKFLSNGLTVNSDGYTPFKVAGKETNLFLPRFNLTQTSLPERERIFCFMEFMVTFTFIIQ